jgi:hypothetical protein
MTREIGEWVAAMESLARDLGGDLIDVDYAIMRAFPGYRLYRIEREGETWEILSTRHENALRYVDNALATRAEVFRDYPEYAEDDRIARDSSAWEKNAAEEVGQ